MNVSSPTTTSTSFSQDLLSWYDQNGRELLWRGLSDPYAIWLSEIIMQQTQVATGTAYWERFMAKFPTVQQLAQAKREEVLNLWQGLGYYRRAHLLHEGANAIAQMGEFPTSAQAWKDIPGVGPYTSAAIASITLNEVIPAIDGNALRVYARVFDIDAPVDRREGSKMISTLAHQHLSAARPGDQNQAIMDLGAHICKPNPLCELCPVHIHCLGRQRTTVSDRPIRQSRTKVTDEDWHFAWSVEGGHALVTSRPKQGIWPGLHCLPQLNQAPEISAKSWQFSHKLTHKNLTIHIHEMVIESTEAQSIPLSQIESCNWPQPFRRWLAKNNYI